MGFPQKKTISSHTLLQTCCADPNPNPNSYAIDRFTPQNFYLIGNQSGVWVTKNPTKKRQSLFRNCFIYLIWNPNPNFYAIDRFTQNSLPPNFYLIGNQSSVWKTTNPPKTRQSFLKCLIWFDVKSKMELRIKMKWGIERVENGVKELELGWYFLSPQPFAAVDEFDNGCFLSFSLSNFFSLNQISVSFFSSVMRLFFNLMTNWEWKS